MRIFKIVVVVVIILLMLFLIISFSSKEVEIFNEKEDFCIDSGGELLDEKDIYKVNCVKGDVMYTIIKLENGYKLIK